MLIDYIISILEQSGSYSATNLANSILDLQYLKIAQCVFLSVSHILFSVSSI